MNNIHTLPPQALEVEKALIGACLMEKNAFDKISSIITHEHFYKNEYSTIFKCISKLSDLGKNVDILTVSDELQKEGTLEKVGGIVELSQIASELNNFNYTSYAFIIKEKYAQRTIIEKASEVLKIAYSETLEDLNTAYSSFTSDVDNLFMGGSTIKHVKEISKDSLNRMENRINDFINGKKTPGISSGLKSLDKLIAGFQSGELVIVAARPAMGKTAIALKFAKEAAFAGNSVCFFSLEMDNTSLYDRLLLSSAGVDRDDFKRGRLDGHSIEKIGDASSDLNKLPIWIDDSHSANLGYIKSVVRSKARKGECKLAVIDYLQLVESPKEFGKNREREVAEISRGLKMLAKETKIPIILLCQLNRSLENREDKTPKLSDLRESGSIEQDADKVIFPWRPEYYNILKDANDESLENIILIEVAKNREGETGTAIAKRNSQFTNIFNNDYVEPTPDDPFGSMQNDAF